MIWYRMTPASQLVLQWQLLKCFQRKCNVGVSAKTKFQMRLIDQSHSCVIKFQWQNFDLYAKEGPRCLIFAVKNNWGQSLMALWFLQKQCFCYDQTGFESSFAIWETQPSLPRVFTVATQKAVCEGPRQFNEFSLINPLLTSVLVAQGLKPWSAD